MILGKVHFRKKKNIENHNPVGGRAHKIGSIVSFSPTLTLIFLILGQRKKGKPHIFKKVSLSKFK